MKLPRRDRTSGAFGTRLIPWGICLAFALALELVSWWKDWSPGLSMGHAVPFGTFVALAQGSAPSDGTVEIEVSASTITEGSSFQVTVTFQGIDSDLFEGLGLPGDFEILGQSSSTSFQLVGGRASRSSALTFDVLPKRKGDYALGPLRFQQGGHEVLSNSVRLKILPRSQARRDAGSHPTRAGAEAAIDGSDAQPQLQARLSAERVYVGQPVTLVIELRHREGTAQVSYRDLQFPRVDGLSAVDQGKPEQNSLVENGLRFMTVRLIKKLTPIREGIFDLHNIQVTADVLTPVQRSRGARGFFDSMMPQFARRSEILTPPADSLRLKVDPLPTEGKPATFSGLVGDSEVSFQFDGDGKKELFVGDSLNLTVRVRSTGDLAGIRLGRPEVNAALKVYEDSARAGQTQGADGADVKEFRFAIVAVQTGKATITPYRLSYFDPIAQRYVTAEHTFAPLTVKAGLGAKSLSDTSGDAIVGRDGRDESRDQAWSSAATGINMPRDLMPIKSGPVVFESQDPTSQTLLISLLGPLAGLCAWLLALLLRGALDQVPVLRVIRYRRGALARARRNLRTLRSASASRQILDRAQAIMSCVRDYLSARTGFAVAQLTVSELEQHFVQVWTESPRKSAAEGKGDHPDVAPLWQALSRLESLAYSGESFDEPAMEGIIDVVEKGLLALDRKL